MTAGYSGTPLAKKLGIKESMTVIAVDAPENYERLIEPLPDEVELIFHDAFGTLVHTRVSARDAKAASMRKPARIKGEIDIIHIFTNTRDGLFRGLAESRNLIKQNGSIWVSWYKKAAKLPTEIIEDNIREAAFPLGLVDVKVCAVDEKWSGLKLVIRKENRL